MAKNVYALTVVTFGSHLFEAFAVIQLLISENGSFVIFRLPELGYLGTNF